MATYNATMRTNYFHVSDRDKFEAILLELKEVNPLIQAFKSSDDTYALGSYTDVNMDEIAKLQEIVPKGECIIVMEAGHENLKYVSGTAYLITKDEINSVDLTDAALRKAREILHNDAYTTRIDY